MAGADAFYAAYLSTSRGGGVPDAAARARYAPAISSTLAGLLDDAAKAEEDFAQITKGQVPPLLEGDIFTSLFEGATGYTVGSCKESGASATCPISLTHTEAGQKPVNWTDTAILSKGPDGWRVDDIGYSGSWDFSNKGKLSETLKFAIANARGE